MKTLQEQITEFEAKGCIAGGRKWEVNYYIYPTKPNYDGYQIDLKSDSWIITVLKKPNERYELATIIKTERNIKLKSTTLESALCEALDIVKAKVMDLAKELGLGKYELLNDEHRHLVETNVFLASDNQSLRQDIDAYEQPPTKEWLFKQAKELGFVCLTEDEYKKLTDPYGRGIISQSTEF